MENEILDFINQFKARNKEAIEELFLNGMCYYFVVILEERFFHRGLVMYIPIYNHFCYKIDGNMYDITGKITNEEYLQLAVLWDKYRDEDILEEKRIIRDCILKVPDKYIP